MIYVSPEAKARAAAAMQAMRDENKQAERMPEADQADTNMQAERMQTERVDERRPRGRPTIGDRKMTATEKQRRWRAKKKLEKE